MSNIQNPYQFFGSFICLCFSGTLLGGWAADHLYSHIHAALIGAVCMLISALLLTIPNSELIYLGLAFNCFGFGCLSPSKPNLLNLLFTGEKEALRQKAFTLSYAWSNAGALMGPLMFGLISRYFSWNAAFYFFTPCLLLWIVGLFKLKRHFYHACHSTRTVYFKNYLLLPLGIGLMYMGLRHPPSTDYLLIIVGLSILIYLLILWFKDSDQKARKTVFLITSSTFLLMVFYAIFFQINSSLLDIYTHRVDRWVGNIEIPVSVLVGLEPGEVVLLTPLMMVLLMKLSETQFQNIHRKILIAFTLEAFAFLIFAYAFDRQSVHPIHLIWPIFGSALLACAEIAIMPTISAMITLLAPINRKGFFMSFPQIALAYSGSISGKIASLILKNEENSCSFLSLALIAILVASLPAANLLKPYLLRPIGKN